ncbi:MAG: IS3 family transposase [Dethiobacteria bacterium]
MTAKNTADQRTQDKACSIWIPKILKYNCTWEQKQLYRVLLVSWAKKANHPISNLCRVLGVSTSGFYAWRGRKPSARAREDAKLMKLIVEIHRESRGTYGAPRIHAELTVGRGIRCSKKRVARLMHQANLVGVHRRRLKGCTKRDPSRTSFPDLVQRSFTATAPN